MCVHGTKYKIKRKELKASRYMFGISNTDTIDFYGEGALPPGYPQVLKSYKCSTTHLIVITGETNPQFIERRGTVATGKEILVRQSAFLD